MATGTTLISRVPVAYSRNPEKLEFGDEMSAANIQVLGVDRPVGLLKESLTAFRKHHGEVADALLNVTDGVDKDDPRPAYKHQAYPKMLYHATHGEAIAPSAVGMEALKAKGYREEPYLKPQVAIADPATEKKVLLDEIKERDGKLAVQNERLLQALERLDALEAAAAKKGK